jgi:signal transduction histidine kinase
MTLSIDPVGEAGLKFYSKISASISHEIKNSLAVINESAGYLEDVSLMAKKGMAIDVNRMEALAGSMLKQVRRADTITKNMNRLAHSLDEPACQTDLNALIELMLRLSERTTVTRGINVSAVFSAPAVTLFTNPFFLQNLIWLILNFAMDLTGETKAIEMMPAKTASGADIRFTGIHQLTAAAGEAFQEGPVRSILAVLKSTLQFEEKSGMIILQLPETINQ